MLFTVSLGRKNMKMINNKKTEEIVLTLSVWGDARLHFHIPDSIWISTRSTEGRLSSRLSSHVTIISQGLDPNNSLVPFSSYFPTHPFHKGTHFLPYSQILLILCIGFGRRVGKIATWSEYPIELKEKYPIPLKPINPTARTMCQFKRSTWVRESLCP